MENLEKSYYVIVCFESDEVTGFFNSYEEAFSKVIRDIREDCPEWEGLDDETVYSYQDGSVRIFKFCFEYPIVGFNEFEEKK